MKIQVNFFTTYGKSKIIVLVILMLVVAHTYSTSAATLKLPPTNLGLVGYWPMDEGVGSVTKDISGSKNNGTLTGGPTWTSGKLGSALTFNGSTQYVGVNYELPRSNSTVSFWVKTTVNDRGIMQWSSTNFLFQTYTDRVFYVNSSGSIKMYVFGVAACGNALNFIDGTTAVNDGKWHHVVGTWTASGKSLYIDGILQTSNATGIGAASPMPYVTLGFGYAQSCYNPPSGYFSGSLDDVHMYNRVLSAAEVQQLYSAGVAKMNTSTTNKNTSGLIGLWSFDGVDTSTTTATDKSGNGNNGTLTNSPTVVTGKIGQALKFDGTSSFVSIGQNVISNNTQLTTCMWFKAKAFGVSSYVDRYISNYYTILGPGNNYSAGSERLYGAIQNGAGGNSIFYGTTVLSLNTWYHGCMVYDGTLTGNTNRGKLFLNGIQETIVSYDATVPASVYTSNYYLGLGRDSSMGPSSPYPYANGSIDDVRIYNRALSAAEVKQIYTTGNGSKVNSSQNSTPSSSLTSGLIGYWPFNGTDISGTTAYDRSTTGNNGTLVSSPTPTTGKIGQALMFNGSNKVTLSSVNPTSFVSVTGWFKRRGPSTNTHHILFMQDTQIEISIPDSTGQIRTGVTTATLGRQVFDSGSGLTDGKWHFLSMTYDGSNLRSYIDGVQTAVNPATGALNTGGSTNIGYYTGYYANAYIDEVRVYNRAISASEINKLYLLGK